MEVRQQAGIVVGGVADRRDHHRAHNKTPDWQIDSIADHIKQYPTMESHYCRQSSHRLYLDSKLSIKRMYEQFRSFYDAYLKDLPDTDTRKQAKMPKENVYRSVFVTQFNLSFFVPKKDQCMVCSKYQSGTAEEKEAGELDFVEHLHQKDIAQAAKKADKQRAQSDPAFVSATFDMQSVLQLPSGAESLLYYKRKLVVHNLTIYEAAAPNKGYCYHWPENAGKRG